MPSDAVLLSEAPEAAIVWLLQGGLLPEEAEHKWGFKWHDGLQRVLVPVLNEQSSMYGLQARAVFGEKPKYKLLQGVAPLFFTPLRPGVVTVVVEDVLSAIAVSKAGVNAVAALGTSLDAVSANRIKSFGTGFVYLWTDPDKAGKAAIPKMRTKLELAGATVRVIKSDRDPKYLSIREIVHKLNE